jgi:hypothetical protein
MQLTNYNRMKSMPYMSANKRLRASTALVVVLLQRMPVARVAISAVEYFIEAPVSSAIKAAAAAFASLGAVDSVAGASSSGGASSSATLVADIQIPIGVTVGQPVKMDVTVTGPAVTFAKSWTVTDTLPPGVTVVGGTLVGSLWVINDDTAQQGILTISGAPTHVGLYKFTIEAWQNTGLTGSVTSGTTSINVSAAVGSVATITTQPMNASVNAGSGVTLTIAATSSGAISYQWYKDSGLIAGATSPSLAISSAQPSDAGTYSVIVTTAGGSITSQAAVLSVSSVPAAPVFSVEPVAQTIGQGSTVVFKAEASGYPTPTFQWFLNGTPVTGATDLELVVSAASPANAGQYTCVATNGSGTVSSAPAQLNVSSTQDIGRLVNISCRAAVGTGGNILIAGFVVGGAGASGSESVLARASGPALVPFNVSGTLPDPELQLFSGSTLVGSNAGWSGNAGIAAAAAAVNAFAWADPTSHDAAIVESLQPGAYTANVSGQLGDTGVALAEIYDATPAGSYSPSSPRIINISARTQVGTGGNVLIAGFVIGGSTSKTVLIRASGPALIPFGVTGTLPDPMLKLNSGATQIASNSRWGGDARIASVASTVNAFTWQFATSNDSAILVTLPPGAYTATVEGSSGDTGVALVEVYDVP